jgi:hypothetical protein
MLVKLPLACALFALGIGTMIGASIAPNTSDAQAQMGTGTGTLMQRSSDGATIGWAARSSDGTKEFWAYVEGEFEFASTSHTASNPWNLRGVYDANLPTGGFEAFRTEVLSRAAAQDKTIIFHNMTVTESITEN